MWWVKSQYKIQYIKLKGLGPGTGEILMAASAALPAFLLNCLDEDRLDMSDKIIPIWITLE